jgi:hypothetical protein
VADALSCIFEGKTEKNPKVCFAALWLSLRLVYYSLEERQREHSFCRELLDKVLSGDEGRAKFQLQGERLCYYP